MLFTTVMLQLRILREHTSCRAGGAGCETWAEHGHRALVYAEQEVGDRKGENGGAGGGGPRAMSSAMARPWPICGWPLTVEALCAAARHLTTPQATQLINTRDDSPYVH